MAFERAEGQDHLLERCIPKISGSEMLDYKRIFLHGACSCLCLDHGLSNKLWNARSSLVDFIGSVNGRYGIKTPALFYMKMPPAFSSFMLVGFKGIRLFFFHILLKGGSIVREIVGCIHLSCLCR